MVNILFYFWLTLRNLSLQLQLLHLQYHVLLCLRCMRYIVVFKITLAQVPDQIQPNYLMAHSSIIELVPPFKCNKEQAHRYSSSIVFFNTLKVNIHFCRREPSGETRRRIFFCFLNTCFYISRLHKKLHLLLFKTKVMYEITAFLDGEKFFSVFAQLCLRISQFFVTQEELNHKILRQNQLVVSRKLMGTVRTVVFVFCQCCCRQSYMGFSILKTRRSCDNYLVKL